MSTKSTPPTPAGMGPRGRRFWRATLAEFELGDAERELLAECCRTLDDLDRLAAMVAEHGATVKGSTGQVVVNPALTEARGQRAILHRLVAALQLPDPDGKVTPAATSQRGKAAARARWSGTARGAS